MSQILQNLASGPVPPSVATSYITDDGTAIPAANILNVNGVDSRENNVNGLLTRANPNLSDNLEIVVTNRVQGVISTSNSTPTPIITFTPTVLGTYAFEVRIAAYNETSLLGAGYSIFGSIRFDGAASNLCGTLDRVVNEEGAMSSATVTMTVAAANVFFNAVGYDSEEINWSAVGLYTFIGVV